MSGLLFVFLTTLAISSTLATCTNPKVTVESFSTQDATILTQIGHIGEFTLKCSNTGKFNLFAEFPCGKVVPVAHIDNDKYQISWTHDVKKGSSGTVVVRLFDDEGYANLRKAQRDSGKTSNVKSLIDVNIATRGAYKGPIVQAELIAVLIISIIAYFALTTKNKVQF